MVNTFHTINIVTSVRVYKSGKIKTLINDSVLSNVKQETNKLQYERASATIYDHHQIRGKPHRGSAMAEVKSEKISK